MFSFEVIYLFFDTFLLPFSFLQGVLKKKQKSVIDMDKVEYSIIVRNGGMSRAFCDIMGRLSITED